MKRQNLIFILLILSSSIIAQSFPLKSSKWYYSNAGNTVPSDILTVYEYEKDTIINDTVGRMISNGLVFYTHNDSVFYYNTKQERFGLLYDYSAEMGDTIEISMPPYLPTNYFSLKVLIDSVTKQIYLNDTLLKFHTTPINPAFYFIDNVYMTRIGTKEFLPVSGASIPEKPYLICYIDSSISINFSGLSCDLITTDINTQEVTESINIFPNPSNGEIIIQSDLYKKFIIQIFNNSGSLVIEDTSEFIIDKKIDVTHLTPGVYMIRLLFDNGDKLTRKIIVE